MPDPDGTAEDHEQPQGIDPLAGVVMYGLISAHPEPMTTDEVCTDVERTPDKPDERAEVEAALRVLVKDGLATCEGGAGIRWKATQAAVRADELAF